MSQLDSSWILYLAIALLPLALGVIGFILSVLNRHKIRAMASLGAVMVMTGGAVAAHESEYGYVPSSLDDIQQVPESVRSVTGKAWGSVQETVSGNTGIDLPSPISTTPRPRTDWLPLEDGQRLTWDIRDGSEYVMVRCAHRADREWNGTYWVVDRSETRTVYIPTKSRWLHEHEDWGDYERACASIDGGRP